MAPPNFPLRAAVVVAAILYALCGAGGTEVLSKSRLESCERESDAGGRLSCDKKLVLDLAVPAGSSGGEASLVTKVVEADNGTQAEAAARSIRDPPVITIDKSAVSAVYGLTYYMVDVAYKPEEHFVQTRKCEPDAGGDVVGDCQRLWNENGAVIEHTEEVIVTPENKTVVSSDNFLRVNPIGDFAVYERSIPSFENMYLVTPRKGAGSGQPQDLGDEHSKWMLLERVRFGPECNKIGVGYEAFQNQPSFCSSPLSNCLNDQLWSYWESDKNRIDRNQVPQYVVEGRSPGKIISIDVETFEALSQVGNANVTTKNTGKLESSYRLTFSCLTGISDMEEQYYVMKPGEVIIRSFDLRSSADRAEKYQCAAILKASDFTEVDRVECQFSTTATVFNNGTQIGSTNERKKGGIWGFLDAIKASWRNFWDFVTNFLTGKSCSWNKCSSLLDITCHVQYICIGWVIMISLLLSMLPTGAVILWLLHQKGFFDPLYDWWEDLFGPATHGGRAHRSHKKGHHHHHRHSHPHPHRHHHVPRHHHVLHRHGHGGQQPEAAAEEGYRRRHGHNTALGVQHRGGAGQHKHRHGKAVALALHFDGPSRSRGVVEEAVEFRERRRHEVRHGLRDGERRL
nr:unnamed protein product [Digitaria exilis]